MTHKRTLQLLLGCSLSINLVACSGVEFSDKDIPSVVTEDTPNVTDPGPNPSLEKESFYPNPVDSKPLVDVLFIVDNSASMQVEQSKLGDRLSSFLGSLKDVDWQIGITTTDTSNGIYGLKGSLLTLNGTNSYILTKNTPNYEEVFADTVVRPEGINCGNKCPSVVERPMQAIAMAIAKADTANRGFFRPGAELAVVVLSDADEGGNGTVSTVTSPAEIMAANALYLGLDKRLTGFGIVIQPGDVACRTLQLKDSKYSYFGTYATALAVLTNGVTGSVCDSNYSNSLKKIGDRVLNLVLEIQLSKMPIAETVKVELIPADPTIQWELKGNKISFNKSPKAGTRVDVEYTAVP